MANKEIVKQGREAIRKMYIAYNALDAKHKGFFELYHDAMLYQLEGAKEDANDINYYLSVEGGVSINKAELCLQNIKDALGYMQGVIKMQKIAEKLYMIYA